MDGTGSVSIYDVAREAGVSYGTVSRALNNRAGVSKATKAHVEKVALQMGFAPSLLARGLANRSSRAVGIIVPGMSDPFFMAITESVQGAAQAMGSTSMLSNTGRQAEAALSAASTFSQFRVAGVVILGGSDRLDSELADILRGVPTVVALRKSKGGVFPSVFVDHAGGARQVVKHLVDQGRRRIAYVGLADDSVAARERLKGYRAGLRSAGIEPVPELILRAGHTMEHGQAATQKLIDLGPRHAPDAIFYADDVMALAGESALRLAGLAVPGDIAIAGFGDVPYARFANPTLTTVSVHPHRVGKLAGQLLEESIANPGSSPKDVRLDVELVIRESTIASPT
jgi:DNA-binding LacI/PurR family transcriptional regulator